MEMRIDKLREENDRLAAALNALMQIVYLVPDETLDGAGIRSVYVKATEQARAALATRKAEA